MQFVFGLSCSTELYKKTALQMKWVQISPSSTILDKQSMLSHNMCNVGPTTKSFNASVRLFPVT